MGKQINYYMGYTDFLSVAQAALDCDCVIYRHSFEIVGTSGISFVEKPPYFSCPSGKIGLLSSMFTDINYRRQGIAKALLTRVINEAREYGCGAVWITASDMGVLLYSDYSFVKNGNFMQYRL